MVLQSMSPPETFLGDLRVKLRRSRQLRHPQSLDQLGKQHESLSRDKPGRQLRPFRNSRFRPPESSPATFYAMSQRVQGQRPFRHRQWRPPEHTIGGLPRQASA
ncbi:hypothetical protein HPB50_017118 [Hyalomma asiaticum]|uniref:Uncharacterized protein n=1 Tax=Hyalomma asiaticum TaxID=266040 RepID=A0ACB7TLU4_HYAAI|nr:hypothetical protein HPB50_017118 [Hyalomma asiaticum]